MLWQGFEEWAERRALPIRALMGAATLPGISVAASIEARTHEVISNASNRVLMDAATSQRGTSQRGMSQRTNKRVLRS